MTELALHLERLGLEQYLDAFVGEGFDTWDTLCYVQESDLETLGVKLGHRRKLQRAIAEHRGISYDRLVNSTATAEVASDTIRVDSQGGSNAGKEGAAHPPTEAKRKYRRHPKADENAPEKPPSAYVLFSNKVREEVKADNLSFTEIAKLVGDRWQKLDPTHKEPFESEAAALKEQYNNQLSAYKKTDAYKEYSQYLADFKAKHGPQAETKRPKLDPQSSGGSLSATSVEILDIVPPASGHGRLGSVSSIGAPSLSSTITSPTGIPPVPASSLPNFGGPGTRGLPTLPRPSSPPQSQPRDRRLVGQLSNNSSVSDDSGQVPYDALSRTATLSLSTPPSNTPPLPAHALGGPRSEQGGSGDPFPWTGRLMQQVHPPGAITPSGPSPLSSGITLPSPTFTTESWRDRAPDWNRHLQTSPTMPVGGQAPALPLPPLLGPDRMPDLGQTPVQRTLPPLRQTTTGPSSSYGSTPTALMSHSSSAESDKRYAPSYDASGRLLDRHENEAASALAGLAARPGSQKTPLSRSYDRPRP